MVMAMDSVVAANLLLAATIGAFVFLTLLAFLMNEGKPIVVRPLKQRIKRLFGCTQTQVLLGEPVIGPQNTAT